MIRLSAHCPLLTAQCLLACLLAAATAAAAPATLRWTAEVARPAPVDWEVFQGETVTLAPTLLQDGVAMTWPTDTTFRCYFQTNGMSTSWWSFAASAGSTTGEIAAVWSPTNDCGAPRYAFFLSAASASGVNYRAYGRLRMRAAPGVSPALLGPPSSFTDALALWGSNYVREVVGSSGAVWRAEWQAGDLALRTGIVDRATTLWSSNAWITINGQTGTLYRIEPSNQMDYAQIQIVEVVGEYLARYLGAIYTRSFEQNDYGPSLPVWYRVFYGLVGDLYGTACYALTVGGAYPDPMEFSYYSTIPGSSGTPDADWYYGAGNHEGERLRFATTATNVVMVTNAYHLATRAEVDAAIAAMPSYAAVTSIVNAAVSTHNSDTNAHTSICADIATNAEDIAALQLSQLDVVRTNQVAPVTFTNLVSFWGATRYADIATNLIHSLVISNGHWLIFSEEP